MSTLSIKRQRTTTLTPKDILRHYVERLSLDQQVEFIFSALQLMAVRPVLQEAKVMINDQRPRLPYKDSTMW